LCHSINFSGLTVLSDIFPTQLDFVQDNECVVECIEFHAL